LPSASGSDASRDFTVAAFNAHWGVGRFGGLRGVRFDVVPVVRGFDADVVVVPESWRDRHGRGMLDDLQERGYHVESVELMKLARRSRTASVERGSVPRDGTWELAICTRFPVLARRALSMGTVRNDAPGERHALCLTLDVHGTAVELTGLHTSSKFWRLAPLQHLATLRRKLPPNGPQVLAGDFNFWGPPVALVMRGWARAVRGPTFPSTRPHSQIDHVLVRGGIRALGGEVLGETPSDHRPIRARLQLVAP
jgi:endonuclease/exonuclease/phosphatase family metal-dependent hydrolase